MDEEYGVETQDLEDDRTREDDGSGEEQTGAPAPGVPGAPLREVRPSDAVAAPAVGAGEPAGPAGEISPGRRTPFDAPAARSVPEAPPLVADPALAAAPSHVETAPTGTGPATYRGPAGEVQPGQRPPRDDSGAVPGPEPAGEAAGGPPGVPGLGAAPPAGALPPAEPAGGVVAPGTPAARPPAAAGGPAAAAGIAGPPAGGVAAPLPGGPLVQQRVEERQQDLRSTLAGSPGLLVGGTPAVAPRPGGPPAPGGADPGSPPSWPKAPAAPPGGSPPSRRPSGPDLSNPELRQALGLPPEGAPKPPGGPDLSNPELRRALGLGPEDAPEPPSGLDLTNPEVKAFVEAANRPGFQRALRNALEIDAQLRARGLDPMSPQWDHALSAAIAQKVHEHQQLQAVMADARRWYGRIPSIVLRPGDLRGEAAWQRYLEGIGVRKGTPDYDLLRETTARIIAEGQERWRQIREARQAGLLPGAVHDMPSLVWVFPEDPPGPTERKVPEHAPPGTPAITPSPFVGDDPSDQEELQFGRDLTPGVQLPSIAWGDLRRGPVDKSVTTLLDIDYPKWAPDSWKTDSPYLLEDLWSELARKPYVLIKEGIHVGYYLYWTGYGGTSLQAAPGGTEFAKRYGFHVDPYQIYYVYESPQRVVLTERQEVLGEPTDTIQSFAYRKSFWTETIRWSVHKGVFWGRGKAVPAESPPQQPKNAPQPDQFISRREWDSGAFAAFREPSEDRRTGPTIARWNADLLMGGRGPYARDEPASSVRAMLKRRNEKKPAKAVKGSRKRESHKYGRGFHWE